MAFQTIYASETDANSPLNQTLMDKIREDIGYLAENQALVYMEEEVSVSVTGSTWTVLKKGMMFVPSFAQKLDIQVECYVASAAANKAVRFKIDDGAGGYDYSDQQMPQTGSYAYNQLTAPETGALTAPGAWRKFYLECRHTESTARTFYVRNLIAKVSAI